MADEIVDQSVEAAATDTLADEIADMMDVEVEVPVEEDPIQQEEVTSESDDMPVEASAKGEEVGEVVSTPESAENVDISELEMLKSQVESLKGIISQLSGFKESDQPKAELKPDLDSLLEKVDFDGIMENKEQFVGFIKDLVTSVAQNTQAYVQGVVPQTITSHMSMQQVREQFYQDNPELDPVRPYVANIASTVAAEQPEWGLQEVLTEAAKRAKAALNIREVPAILGGKGPSPTLPGSKGGGRKPAPQKTALQNELDEFLED